MNSRDERRDDVIENCDILLDRLSRYPQTDSTPEGRMISQLRWLKEKAEAGSLELPIDQRYIATLKYVYTDGSLRQIAASKEEYARTVEVYQQRLLSLTKEGAFLAKSDFYPYVVRCINKLIGILNNAPRPLSDDEKACISELNSLAEKLTKGKIEPPLLGWKNSPDFQHFRKVYAPWGSTIDDLPEGKEMSRLVADFVFNGRRPQSWVTTDRADLETSFWD